jgi:hypothetical protein
MAKIRGVPVEQEKDVLHLGVEKASVLQDAGLREAWNRLLMPNASLIAFRK